MKSTIKTIEDLSLNAWPSHQIQIYDGWLLRFSYFYTHRTNSVEQIGASTIPLDEKIAYCEEVYKYWGTPTIFKISPLVKPSFDFQLESIGYEIQHTNNIMVLAKSSAILSVRGHKKATLYNFIPNKFLEALFKFKRVTNAMHLQIVPWMYQAIPKKTICAIISRKGETAAIGLGILDRNYVGLYAIHVDEKYRQEGLGRDICVSILSEAFRRGIDSAYLQVVDGNTPAERLYSSLGFVRLYTDWFRVK